MIRPYAPKHKIQRNCACLEEHIKSYPNAKAHSLLAHFYQESAKEKCWFHLRQAHILEPNNPEHTENLSTYWKYTFCANCGLQIGFTKETIIPLLGEPDLIFNERGHEELIYGNIAITVINGKYDCWKLM